ncbi:hypothetical protein A2U01_0061107, partial [Trifolium medium]|nr:hypothetical protein [Trifolium medium]
FAHVVDNFVKTVQEKMIEERGLVGLNKMKEIFERCNRKRLTLIPHYDLRVEEIVVNEVLSAFNLFEEEFVKAEEEKKRRKEAEEKRQQEEEEKLKRLFELATQEDKGQTSAYEHDPLLLIV